ncbi:MAG: SdrD B-like domain-containing protein [Caldilineaceae bacterium]
MGIGLGLFFTLFVFAAPIVLYADDTPEATPTPTQQNQRTTYDHLRAAKGGFCDGLFKLVGTDYCTHGPDEPPPGLKVDQQTTPLLFAAGTDADPVLCDGDGVSGNRVQVIYVHPADQLDRFEQYRESIQQWAAEVDNIYNQSAQETGGTRHIRFVHDSNCHAEILNVVIPAHDQDSFTASISAIQAQGLNRTDRKYLMFVDSNIFCGIGGMFSDESVDANNRNNIGPSYARVDNGCWGARVAAHELMHNFGGVQFGAPNSSAGYHCTDEWDVMCYSDPPNYPTITIKCPDLAHDSLLDCNHDDYYHTNPPAGSYLATHWNPAFNQFLIWENQPLPTPTFTPTTMPTLLPNCRSYPALSLPAPIYDQQTVTATIQVPDAIVIDRLRLFNLQIRHTYVSDLKATLLGPDGKQVMLFQEVGGNKRDFMGTSFTDNAATAIGDGIAPFSNNYRPVNALGIFAATLAQGEWKLVITDTAFRDAGFLAAADLEICSSQPLPTPIATSTPTPSPTATSNAREIGTATPTNTPVMTPTPQSLAKLTVNLVVEPESIQDFRFTLNDQTFTLDDPLADDGDAISSQYTTFLEPGDYTLTQLVPHTWFLTNIGCTLSAEVNMHITNPAVHLALTPGADIACTFRSQRNVIVRTLTYEDTNQNQQYDEQEAWLQDWQLQLYSEEGVLLQSQRSNSYGKANFNGLPAGRYQVCQVIEADWHTTHQSGRIGNDGTQSCFQLLLAPAQIATIRFGNIRMLNAATNPPVQPPVEQLSQDNLNQGVEITLLADVADDVDGYGNSILEDSDINMPVLTWHNFLPLISGN